MTFISFEHTATYTAKRGGKAMATFWAILLWATSWRVGTVWVDCKPTWHQMRKWFLPRLRHIQTVPLVMFQPENVQYKTTYTLGENIHLLAVGRLIRPKRFDWAIKAAAAVQKKHPHKKVSLTIIGEGPENENLTKIAALHHIKLHLPGYDAHWQSKAHTFDAFLMPSENEGLSMSTLEAMAAGLPVVACAVGGIARYGKHWHNMALVETSSIQHFAATAADVLQKPILRENMGHFARHDALRLFSVEALSVAKKHAFSKS